MCVAVLPMTAARGCSPGGAGARGEAVGERGAGYLRSECVGRIDPNAA